MEIEPELEEFDELPDQQHNFSMDDIGLYKDIELDEIDYIHINIKEAAQQEEHEKMGLTEKLFTKSGYLGRIFPKFKEDKPGVDLYPFVVFTQFT